MRDENPREEEENAPAGPESQPSLAALPLIGLVRLYRLILSPYLGGSCRFVPSCSQYGLDALGRFGALRGALLTLARVLRCHPFCEGGYDPVPPDGAVRWRRPAHPPGGTPTR